MEIEVDFEAGTLGGPDAEEVRPVIEQAVKEGTALAAPWPTDYELTEPLRSPRQLAAILWMYYLLPDELAAELDGPADEDEWAEITVH